MSELIRIEQRCNERYKTIDLRIIENDALSWRAKGLHTYLISRPPGWKLWYKDLEQRATDGKAAIGTAVKELQAAGYLRIERLLDERRRVIGSRWVVVQSPEMMPAEGEPYPDSQDAVEPYTGFPDTGFPDTDRPYTGNPLRSKKQRVLSNISTTHQEDMPVVFCDGAAYSTAFEEAWGVWLRLGRGENKQGAAKAWNATIRSKMNGNAPEASAAILLKAVRNFGEAMRTEGRAADVVMYASTFFGRDQRWKDYENWTPSAVVQRGGASELQKARVSAEDIAELDRALAEKQARRREEFGIGVTAPKEEAVAGGGSG